MPAAVSRLLGRIRRRLLERLRPGRNEAELVELIAASPAIQSEEQRHMLRRLIEFQDTRVREVMVPRSDIHAIEAGQSIAEAERRMIETGVSRLPVYEGDLDHVIGIVRAKDVLAARAQGELPRLSAILRPCLRVSEFERIAGLLAEMRRTGSHLAIALDEYGGVAGLVTLSDLIEEIVGAIADGEQKREPCQQLPDGSWMVEGVAHVEELEAALGRSIRHGDYDTVGGWITTAIGRIPSQGEELSIDGLNVQVLDVDPRRIRRVRIRPAG